MEDNFYSITFLVIFLCVFPLLFTVESAEYEVNGALYNRWEVPHVAEDGVVGVGEHPVVLYNSDGEQLATGKTRVDAMFSLTYEGATPIDQENTQEGPTEYKLGNSYPNPFNPKTTIKFESPDNTDANISVYNILGQKVMHTQERISRGTNEIKVNLSQELSQGIYLLHVSGDGFSKTEKMTYVSRGISSGSPGITVKTTEQNTDKSRSLNKQSANVEEKYRLVLEETDVFHKKEIEIPANQDYDAGEIEIARKKSYWQGTITGQGIYKDNLEKFESGFTMEVVNFPVFVWENVDGKNLDIFNGWARAQYMHPGWASLGCDWTRQFTVETPMNAGEIGGVLDWSNVRGDIDWDYGIYYREELRPTYTHRLCAGGICGDPETDETSILGFGGVYGSYSSPGFPFSGHAIQLDFVKDGDIIKVSLPEEYKETTMEYTGDGGETLTRTVQYNITGELYRVNWEEHELKEGEIVETDEHTRKKIDHEIEDPDGGDPMEQFEMYLDAQSKIEALTTSDLEFFRGKLRMKVKNLSAEQLKIKTPIAVTGVRGTDYEMQVDDSTTTVTVFEGEVEFSKLDGTGTVTVGANEKSNMKEGGAPTEPKSIGDRPKISKWWETY